MNLDDLSKEKRYLVDVHLQQILMVTGVKIVTIQLSDTDSEERDNLRRILFERHGESTYNKQSHRTVAIMAADREPGDAAKAVEDVMTTDPRAGGVFDAVGAAFATLAAGEYVDLLVVVNRERVTIENYSPPREGETVLGTLKSVGKSFEPAMRGECVSAVARDIGPGSIAKYALDQHVFERAGEGYREVIITGIAHYRNSRTSYQVEDIDPKSTSGQRWWDEEALFETVPEE